MNATTTLYSFIHNDMDFPLLHTTDMKVLNEVFKNDTEKEIFTGAVITMKTDENNYLKYNVNSVKVHIYSRYHDGQNLSLAIQGQFNTYCCQLEIRVTPII
ncbi:MAG: hypothetical protein WBP45_09170 [Daejeonella sp.]